MSDIQIQGKIYFLIDSLHSLNIKYQSSRYPIFKIEYENITLTSVW